MSFLSPKQKHRSVFALYYKHNIKETNSIDHGLVFKSPPHHGLVSNRIDLFDRTINMEFEVSVFKNSFL